MLKEFLKEKRELHRRNKTLRSIDAQIQMSTGSMRNELIAIKSRMFS